MVRLHTSAMVTLFGLQVLAAGCGAPADEASESSSALYNGTHFPAGRPEVVKWDTATGYCTATMLSSTVFVSAAHCIQHAWQARGGTIETVLGTSATVDRVFSQGAADAASGSSNPDDIAFGRTVSPLSGFTPATISTAEPSAGWLSTVGYGCTGDDLRNSPCSPADRTFIDYWYNGSTPSNFGGHGDSGGPTFIGHVSDNGPIVRIFSGWPGINPHDIGSDAVKYRAEILGMATALTQDGISYRGQVQSIGWQPAVQNGALEGTTGRSLRLEGLQVWSPRPGVSVCYQVYVQNSGFQPARCDGDLAGTVGQSLRVEFVLVWLATKPLGTNGVKYNAYFQDLGWVGWKQDGAVAGSYGKRLEAIEIQLY